MHAHTRQWMNSFGTLFHDKIFSLSCFKFPDISRFSRQVVTLNRRSGAAGEHWSLIFHSNHSKFFTFGGQSGVTKIGATKQHLVYRIPHDPTITEVHLKLEMTMGMGFPMGMGIPWDSHGNGNWWQHWEWEGMGNNLYGNGNGHYSHGNQFSSADTLLSLCNSTVYCKLSTQITD